MLLCTMETNNQEAIGLARTGYTIGAMDREPMGYQPLSILTSPLIASPPLDAPTPNKAPPPHLSAQAIAHKNYGITPSMAPPDKLRIEAIAKSGRIRTGPTLTNAKTQRK